MSMHRARPTTANADYISISWRVAGRIAKRRLKLLVALTAAIALVTWVGVTSAAASTPDEDLVFAQQLRHNCELRAQYATTAEETAAAQACIAIQDEVIAGLTAPSPSTTPESSPAPSPVVSSWPTVATAGLPEGSVPAASGPCVLSTPGAVYTGRTFDCSGAAWLAVTAPGVVIEGSLIYAGQWGGIEVQGNGSLTIRDSTVRAKGSNRFARESAVSGGNLVAERVKVYSGGDGFFISGDNVTVRDSYIETHPLSASSHSDGIQLYSGGSNVVLDHNTWTLRGTPSTGPINWSGANGPAVVITNNLLVGGPYSLRIGATSGAGAVVSGNVIARNEWGPDGEATDIPNPCGTSRPITWVDNDLGDVSGDYSAVTNRVRLLLPC